MSTKKKVVSFEHFDLTKFKFVDKNVEISYFDLEDRETLQNPKSNHLPHQKLIDSLDDFKEIFAKASGHLSGWEFARESLRIDLDLLQEAKKGYDNEVENHKVSGVSFVGDKMKGIQISGSFKSLLNSYGYASPKVYFEDDKISYGEEAKELAEKLRERVYAYLFLGELGAKKKKSEETVDPNQASILDPDQQVNPTETHVAEIIDKPKRRGTVKPKPESK